MGSLSPGLTDRLSEWMIPQMCPSRSLFAILPKKRHHPCWRQGAMFTKQSSNFLSSKSKGKNTFVLKWCHSPPAVWWCLLFFTSTAGRELLAAARAPLLPAAEPSRLRQSWEHLYSGHKRTMKRFLTAALCQLAAATGSSECKLRTSTINKAMSNRVCTCSTPVRVCAAML